MAALGSELKAITADYQGNYPVVSLTLFRHVQDIETYWHVTNSLDVARDYLKSRLGPSRSLTIPIVTRVEVYSESELTLHVCLFYSDSPRLQTPRHETAKVNLRISSGKIIASRAIFD